MAVTNTLAYYNNIAAIKAGRGFIVQAPEAVFLVMCDLSMNEL
jgi:hypothetical protein